MLRRLLTIVGYCLVVALVVGVTALLVAYGKGYSYNFKTGRLIRTGLIIIQSSPSGVPVTVGSKATNKKTPFRSSFEAGSYTFTLAKDGFHTWTKTLQLNAFEARLVPYAILVPTKPGTVTLDTQTQVVAQSISHDHRHIAYITGGVTSAVYTLDFGNPKPVKVYTPKVATPSAEAETLTGLSWSEDASHVLIVSNVGTTPTHQLISASGGDLRDLTAQYGFNFTGLKFSGTNWQQLFWISPDGLRRLDMGSQSVSAVLAAKVTQFEIAGDRVLYVQSTEIGRTLWSLDRNNHAQQLIQALPESTSYSITFVSYNGQPQLAVVPAGTGTGTLYSDIYGSNPVAKLIARNVTTALFSPDGHFLSFWSAGTIQTYDLERSNFTTQTTLYSFSTAAGTNSALTWFDNYHVLVTRDNRTLLGEYDGANIVDLGPTVGGLASYGSSDNRLVYRFVPVLTGLVSLQTMTIKP